MRKTALMLECVTSDRALSLQSSLDGEDAIAVTASAQLHLNLSGATHQKLGLVGKRSEETEGECMQLSGSKTSRCVLHKDYNEEMWAAKHTIEL